ncbi:MAG: FtsX-like permease family protein [Planctomycetaceae bacterium]
MMRLILRSLFWHLRTHLMVMLAVAVSTAVIGGALIVGDSVRASLRHMTLSRLGSISHVLHSPRFVRQQLASDLNSLESTKAAGLEVHPALMLTGSVEKKSADGSLRRATEVGLTGISSDAWKLFESDAVKAPSDQGLVLGYRTATELQATTGDEVSVWVELPSSIPRDSLLGERENVSVEIVLKIEGVLPESAGATRFSLQPAQQLPHNAFLSLSTFQQRLNLEEREATRRNPIARPGRVNTLLIGTSTPVDSDELRRTAQLASLMSQDVDRAKELNDSLTKSLKLADVGLRIRRIADRGYLSVESDSMILEKSVEESVTTAASSMGMLAVPSLVYLANEINAADRPDNKSRFSMYSIVAGLDYKQPKPLGPFLLDDGSPVPFLNENDIVLSAWLAQDLQVKVGDTVQARWHEVGSHGDLPETQRSFTVRGILKADDPVSIDRDITPFVDGVTNVETFGDWDQPFDMEMDRITTRDDEWWEEHRATPKAFVSIETARKFWSSRFGQSTSLRIASAGVELPEDRLTILENRLMDEIPRSFKPLELGLYIRPVRVEGLMASTGANDFTQLFLGFSFFLILSAILLAALMFQLSVRQRVAQIGLLEAVGFTASRARRAFTLEGFVVALLGSIVGAVAAVYFAKLMIYGLTTWWVGAIGTQFLLLEILPERLVMASAIAVILSTIVIWNSVRRTTQRSPRELLAGMASDDIPAKRHPLVTLIINAMLVITIAASVGLPAASLLGLVPAKEAFGGLTWPVVCFFLSGFAWLTSSLLLLQSLLRRRAGEAISGGEIQSLSGLALASAARNPARSLLTTVLIAFATFVIVAVGAGRRNPVSEVPDLNSGNGGFRLVAESSSPVLFDPNTKDGRLRLGLDANESTKLPENTKIFTFRTRPGEDASCLNLFQATVPTLLGATKDFIERGGFRFANTPGEKPWQALYEQLPPAKAGDREIPSVPVIGDMNTLQFSLKKGIGDRILFPNDDAPTHALQIAGMLDSSIFQGVLVMSDENLLRVSPESSGARYFLIEASDSEAASQTAKAMETALQAYGVDTDLVSQRLADFLAVQNTYLSTFQMLGGLGLLVGTLGLAAVMIRNVLERRTEIAMLRAFGFRTTRIMWLIFAENTLLLLWGLIAGALSALIAMAPHLLGTGADVPWTELGITLATVLAVGTFASMIPVWNAVRISVREVLVTA